MATFTVGSFASNMATNNRGQGFTPDVAGPDGTGSPGSATTVYLQEFSIGYNNSSTNGRAGVAYLYTAIPSSISDVNSGTGSAATSTGCSDGNVFGGSNYSRTFVFDDIALAPDTTYYVLFPSDQNIRVKSTNNYTGGELVKTNLSTDSGKDAQFQAVFSDTI